ncbi:phage holin family protein, partial [Saccharopolyspora sp. NPDC002686]|uniref:phage holin family protein n=1 Tax=Saccharopolyspora sp. NPDC002686 TaxID=3154541 RepID=UPI0033309F9F
MAVVLQLLITMVAVWITTALPGIDLAGEDTTAKVLTLLAVSVIFGMVNVVLKPIVSKAACPETSGRSHRRSPHRTRERTTAHRRPS